MIVLIIFVLLILVYLYYNVIEHFDTYKSVTVVPQPMVYDKLNMYINLENEINMKIAKNIQNIYPIDKIVSYKLSNDVLNKLQNSSNSVGIVNDESFQSNEEPTSNIRFICTVGVSSFILIVNAQSNFKTWNNFKDRSYRFGTDIIGSSSDITLNKIHKSILNEYVHSIKYIEYNPIAISNAFKNNLIDAYFIIQPDPDNVIQFLTNRMPVYLIGTKGLDPVKLSILFPNSQKTFIDGSKYSKKIYGSIPTILVPIHLLATSNIPGEYIRILIRSLFENFVKYKSSGDEIYIQQMFEFNPQYLYPNYLNPNKYIIHDGAKKYFEEIGIITYNPNKDCVYTLGIDKCKDDLYINPYRLML